MREQTKKREFCKECGRITHQSECIYTCDYCKSDMTEKMYNPNQERCSMKVFFEDHNIDTHDYDFCDWECFLPFLAKMNLTHFNFISMPHIKKADLETVQEFLRRAD